MASTVRKLKFETETGMIPEGCRYIKVIDSSGTFSITWGTAGPQESMTDAELTALGEFPGFATISYPAFSVDATAGSVTVVIIY